MTQVGCPARRCSMPLDNLKNRASRIERRTQAAIGCPVGFGPRTVVEHTLAPRKGMYAPRP